MLVAEVVAHMVLLVAQVELVEVVLVEMEQTLVVLLIQEAQTQARVAAEAVLQMVELEEMVAQVVVVLLSSLTLVHKNGLEVPIAHQAETQYIPILVKDHLHLQQIILHS